MDKVPFLTDPGMSMKHAYARFKMAESLNLFLIFNMKALGLFVVFSAIVLSGGAATKPFSEPDSLVAESDSLGKKFITIAPEKVVFREVGKLPKVLREASGLQRSDSGYFWSHNDDGVPALYCLDSLGNQVKAVQLNVSNKGWEDLTRDESGNFYIGGFGNNKNDRKELRIYRIPNPDDLEAPLTNPEIITYSYEDQKVFPASKSNKNFDADAFFAWKGNLYLFTKNRSSPFKGISKIYRLSQEPGNQSAKLIDSLFVGTGPMINNWITSADLSPDGKTLALLFHDRILFIRNFTEDRFSRGAIYELKLNHYSHKAGICWTTNNKLYIVDELELDVLGGKMYSVDLSVVWKDRKS